jgi:hypothetical protein
VVTAALVVTAGAVCTEVIVVTVGEYLDAALIGDAAHTLAGNVFTVGVNWDMVATPGVLANDILVLTCGITPDFVAGTAMDLDFLGTDGGPDTLPTAIVWTDTLVSVGDDLVGGK